MDAEEESGKRRSGDSKLASLSELELLESGVVSGIVDWD